jgi:molybdopterin/thiamine biosynthesis adenylyltransferase
MTTTETKTAGENGQSGSTQALSPYQVNRYSRHIIMPQVGSAGQRALLDAKVLLVGAGGLGSPIAVYLTLAGVGTIGIVEFDEVDVTNLQRQILHTDADVGKSKAQSAFETLKAYNKDVNVILHEAPLTSENAMDIIPDYGIIVNGADNFATRYLVNDASYLAGKPLVDGSILLFDGQATVFLPGKGCYRCLFPQPPEPGEVPSCSEAGVLGVLPGMVGTIQATETVKLIMGIGKSLSGRLLLIDALDMEFRSVKIRRDPACPLCGDNPTVTELIDYNQFCGTPPLV